jgi:hypothetical protein
MNSSLFLHVIVSFMHYKNPIVVLLINIVGINVYCMSSKHLWLAVSEPSLETVNKNSDSKVFTIIISKDIGINIFSH